CARWGDGPWFAYW
nr:immunoglobulin heavy chain junction region [Mus musculus]